MTNAEVPDTVADIRTPPSKPGLLQSIAVPHLLAWLGVRLLRHPLRLGKLMIVAKHRDVQELLRRDLDFRIGPVNARRIGEVNGGPFILGMDRAPDLSAERTALYRALSRVDLEALAQQADQEARDILDAAATSIDAVGAYARLVAGHTARRLFGIVGPDDQTVQDAARAIFAHTFLNIGDDQAVRERAVMAGDLMRNWLAKEISRRTSARNPGDDLMGQLLRASDLDHAGIRRNLGGMFVGSIDTTATAVAKILVIAGRDKNLRTQMVADCGNPERLRGWCWEALRRWPHNPILMRKAFADTSLADKTVPAGTTMIVWTQAAMLDPDAFPEPQLARPDRGASAYLHFGAGLHPCAGRALNNLQIPMLVGHILPRMESLGPIQWAGPFPDRLTITLRRP